ncbi:glycosyltransferase [Algibacter pectinivorans]|uniref:Glycosyl transferases group 1 n=1 Tax=Algibacter pectinivorans TaxID=870482 RepID=A0A1I1P7C4_9FLAO|nr:glycosyltransferase [Algibacter pectinivorans]SFD02883.1 hypothetical protein SAMN04487987_10342 [Algibacter pectinivorans]
METIYILNIPNFYSSYYLYGLNKEFNIKFKMDDRFLKYNNRPFLIFKIKDKIGVINNDDPVYFNQNLYDQSDVFFVTNKLLDNPSFKQEKVKPLFPHYPINIVPLYLKLFNFKLLKYLKPRVILKELYTLKRRPGYKDYNVKVEKDNYIFFSSSIWKNELETNTIRAEFIRYCKADDRVEFEGGFIPRSDGENLNFDAELNHVKYPPKLFSSLSKKSKIVLNNAAVWGAVSWRLAEYLNQGLFVLSFPFKIDLPINLEHNQELYAIEESIDFKVVFDKVLNNPDYHTEIALNGKAYFSKYCTPSAQAKQIIKTLLN